MSQHWPMMRWCAVLLASLVLWRTGTWTGLQTQESRLVATQIVNGGFESGPEVGWFEHSALDYDVIVDGSALPPGVYPHDGSWEAWLAGSDDEVSYIEQTVTIAEGVPVLGFWYWIDSIDAVCGYDWARLVVNGVQVDAFPLCTPRNTGGWRKYTRDLSAYAGQTIKLRIQGDTDRMSFSSLHVDDVALEARQTYRLRLPSLLKGRALSSW